MLMGFNVGLPQVHTSDLNDGYDWGRLNLQSVTEQSQLDEFLATAELAGTEFTVGPKTLANIFKGGRPRHSELAARLGMESSGN